MDELQMIDELKRLLDAECDAVGLYRRRIEVEIANRLDALKSGIEDAQKHHKQEIDLLSDQIKTLTTPHPQDGETIVGGDVYRLGDDANGN